MPNKKQTKKTIKIAGAGISGLTAAICLAKAGYRVEVYERNETSGKRFEGDFQGIQNWGFNGDALDFLKSIGIKINFECTGFKKISIWGPKGIKKNFTLRKPSYYLVKRGTEKGSLDYGLKEQSLANKKIKLFYNHPVKPNEVDIVATGPVFNDSNKDGFAAGYVFKTDISDQSIMIFNDDCAIDGYSYFLVHNNYGVIVTVIIKNFEKLNDYREKTLKFCQKNKKFKMINARKFSGTCNVFLPKIPNDKKIYIGEACGMQDYLWGFGMRYAIVSAHLAAKSIVEKKDFYKLYKKEILPKIKTSVSNRLIFKMLGNRSYRTFINNLAKIEDPLDFLDRFYKPSLLKSIVYPVARLYFRKNLKDPR